LASRDIERHFTETPASQASFITLDRELPTSKQLEHGLAVSVIRVKQDLGRHGVRRRNLVDQDDQIRFPENDAPSHQFNPVIDQFEGGSRVARPVDQVAIIVITDYLGVSFAGICAFLTVVILVAGAIHQHGIVGYGKPEEPVGLPPIIRGAEVIGQKSLAAGLDRKSVPIGMLVVRRPAAPERHDRVVVIPARPCHNPVQVESDVLEFVRRRLPQPIGSVPKEVGKISGT
jgi:hypothetical protein